MTSIDSDDDVISPEYKRYKRYKTPKTHTSRHDRLKNSLIRTVINLFSAEGFLTKLYLARNKILTQAREGKRAFFMFQYPILGWYQYDNKTIEGIYQLSEKKSGTQLAEVHLNEKYSNKIRIHAIAALLIQREDLITKLYHGAKRARLSDYKKRNVSIVFRNPFRDIFSTDKDFVVLNGNQLIKYQNIGHRSRFNPFLPLNKTNIYMYNSSVDVDPDTPDMTTSIGM